MYSLNLLSLSGEILALSRYSLSGEILSLLMSLAEEGIESKPLIIEIARCETQKLKVIKTICKLGTSWEKSSGAV